MKLPFIFRRKFIVVYVPIGKKDFNDLPLPQYSRCYHDKRIGWVEPKRFNTYKDYMNYLKSFKEGKDI